MLTSNRHQKKVSASLVILGGCSGAFGGALGGPCLVVSGNGLANTRHEGGDDDSGAPRRRQVLP